MKYSKAEQIILVIVVCSLCLAGHLWWEQRVNGAHLASEEYTTGQETKYFNSYELATIRTAAIRNGIQPGTDNWYILLAIRKAEAGKPGLEFGIMDEAANDLDSQAGWAAASILGARGRWDGKGDFVDAMGARYCPINAENDPDGLNANWAGNVKYWTKKLRGVK